MKYRDQKKNDENQQDFNQDFKRWKYYLCPLCRLECETQFHVIGCTSKRASKHRKKTHTIFFYWFEQQHTDPILSQCILFVLHHNDTVSFTEAMTRFTDENTYLVAAQSQDVTWKFLQESHINRRWNGKRFSNEACTKRLIYHLYVRLLDIWRRRCELERTQSYTKRYQTPISIRTSWSTGGKPWSLEFDATTSIKFQLSLSTLLGTHVEKKSRIYTKIWR